MSKVTMLIGSVLFTTATLVGFQNCGKLKTDNSVNANLSSENETNYSPLNYGNRKNEHFDESVKSNGSFNPQFVDLPWVAKLGSLTKKIFNPEIRVSLAFKGTHANSEKEKRIQFTKDAVLSWIHAMKRVDTDGKYILPGAGQINEKITVFENLENPDITVFANDKNGRGIYYPIPGFIHIDAFKDSDAGTYLHEFGHAFGLGDTYIEGNGSCKDGQYGASVMCNHFTLSGELTADDIRGISFQYCTTHPQHCSNSLFSDAYGGSGGSSKTVECGGKVLKGLEISSGKTNFWFGSGKAIHKISPICSTINGTSIEVLDNGFGGNGGSYKERFSCPGTASVTGVNIFSNRLVRGIQVSCSDGSTSKLFGEASGTSNTYSCEQSGVYKFAMGIRGAVGFYVDRLGLSCGDNTGAVGSLDELKAAPNGWQTGCLKESGGTSVNTFLAFKDNTDKKPTTFAFYTSTYSNDVNCTNNDVATRATTTVISRGSRTVGVTAIDSKTQKLEIMPLSAVSAAQLNRESRCDKRNWVFDNQWVDVTASSCFTPSVDFSIFKVTGNELYFGESSQTYDGRSEAKRPISLSTTGFRR